MCKFPFFQEQLDGLVQDCSNSSANALELLQSYTLSHQTGLWQVDNMVSHVLVIHHAWGKSH